MDKRLLLSFLFLAIPSAGHGQSPSSIYVDCDVVRSYTVPEKKLFRERLNFKIDTLNKTIFEYDFDKGVYLSQCEKFEDEMKIENLGKASGTCFVDDEAFRYMNIKNSILFHISDSITIYRSSGRLTGNSSMYSGSFKRGEFNPNKGPMADYALNGSCQKGADLSTSKKAF